MRVFLLLNFIAVVISCKSISSQSTLREAYVVHEDTTDFYYHSNNRLCRATCDIKLDETDAPRGFFSQCVLHPSAKFQSVPVDVLNKIEASTRQKFEVNTKNPALFTLDMNERAILQLLFAVEDSHALLDSDTARSENGRNSDENIREKAKTLALDHRQYCRIQPYINDVVTEDTNVEINPADVRDRILTKGDILPLIDLLPLKQRISIAAMIGTNQIENINYGGLAILAASPYEDRTYQLATDLCKLMGYTDMISFKVAVLQARTPVADIFAIPNTISGSSSDHIVAVVVVEPVVDTTSSVNTTSGSIKYLPNRGYSYKDAIETYHFQTAEFLTKVTTSPRQVTKAPQVLKSLHCKIVGY